MNWLPQTEWPSKKKLSPLPWPSGPAAKRVVAREPLPGRALLRAYSVVAYLRSRAVELKLCVVSVR